MNALVLLRTHTVGAQSKTAFLRLQQFTPDSTTKLLIDTSRGDLRTEYPALTFDAERLRRMGLELFPAADWAWFSGDYALYCVLQDAPDYDYYVMIDYDVRVNFSIDSLVCHAHKDNLDFVAAYAGFSDDSWMWLAASKLWFDRAAGSFFPLVLISKRLLMKCLEVRLEHTRQIPTDPSARQEFLRNRWVNCEAFVPSVALQYGYNVRPIHDVVQDWTYEYFRDVDALSWDLPEIDAVPCAHPAFIDDDLPYQLRRRLEQLSGSSLSSWLIERSRSLLQPNTKLWDQVCKINPELQAE